MRITIAIVLVALMVALAVCATMTKYSKRRTETTVERLLLCLLPPMLGNLIIILATDETMATVGCYMYYMGIDLTMLALFTYTTEYCRVFSKDAKTPRVVRLIILADMVQLALNPILGHAFATRPLLVEGSNYYTLVPLLWQQVHRIVDYGIFAYCLGTFCYRSVVTPRIYAERYTVILMVMIITGAWQTFYVLSGTPIDCSMIGYGVFGLLVFYFSLFYRPMRLLDRMLASVVSNMDESYYFFDREGACIYANGAGSELVGLDSYHIGEAPTVLQKMLGYLPFDSKNREWSIQRHSGKGADTRFFVLEYHEVSDDKLKQVGSYLNVRDRTAEEKALQEEMRFARQDRLTGLYNKDYLYQCARELIDANPETAYAAIAVDVRDFKIVNDIFGTRFGDLALRRIAEWIQDTWSGDALTGRLTGDKFGIIAPADTLDPEALEYKLNRFVVSDGERSHTVLLHLGVYEIAERDISISVMFDRAFLAISSIKNDYQVHIAYYGEDMRSEVVWDQAISSQLAGAIAERQIVPYLQPIVDGEGKTVGAEVLVRWIHPTEGFLSPARFIPVFEENGMIAELDLYMWRCACELLGEWQLRGVDLFLSVNISPKDFYFMNVFDVISNLASEYCIDPRKLRLEITETVVMNDLENRMQILDSLRRYGFLVEMDDFGSGYSSLNMLKDMPVDLVKIDMMFLYKSKNQDKAQTILRSVVDLTRNLGMLPLTEGVETPEQFSMLAVMGCALFQGYYFAKPMPVPEFEEFCQIAG